MEYGKKFIEHMDRYTLKPISFLEGLSTPRLLTYFKKHRKLRYVGMCDCGCGEPMSSIVDLDLDSKKYFDNCIEYVDAIKSILDKREHV